MKKSIFVLIVLTVVLAACAPAQSAADIQAQIDAAVAQTMEAERQIAELVEQTVAAQAPLATPTAAVEVVQPTATAIVLPTFTALPTVTPVPVVPQSVSSSGSSGGGSVSSSDPFYSCDVISRRPLDLTEIHHGDSFDIKWTIVNTGTKSWPAGYDVKYYSGPKMSPTLVVELPAMAPGDTFEVILDAFAPQEGGFHVMTYTVEGQLCFPYVAINVE